jgi:hypothetical protein
MLLRLSSSGPPPMAGCGVVSPHGKFFRICARHPARDPPRPANAYSGKRANEENFTFHFYRGEKREAEACQLTGQAQGCQGIFRRMFGQSL